MKDVIRIASGQGFWGDLPRAPIDQVRNGEIDYLVMDYLAEVTMSILQKQKMRNPEYGYARDFVDVVAEVLPDISQRGIRIISNAGGVNPIACKDAIFRIAGERGFANLKIAVIDGDDILGRIKELIDAGHELRNMDDNRPIKEVADQLLSANVYFGAQPVVDALKAGADIVITGRVTDTGLTLAPMIYEFGWDENDFDRMAAGTIAGHIIECGAQCTGGNFTDWESVPDIEAIGFPIIEAYPDAHFVVTKHQNTGGLVSLMTVKEQLVYEIGDPTEYITPDCVADFTSIRLGEDGKDRVKVSGIKGRPATEFYKVSASYNDGYKLSSTLVYSWPGALAKAQKAGDILRRRSNDLKLEIDVFRAEYVGFNGCNEVPLDSVSKTDDLNEVQLRISVSGQNRNDIDRFGKEIAPLILTGPGGVTGFAGGRPKASEIVAFWPALIKKEACNPRLQIFSL
ncbi:MAG TPA: acyclic terpene utilization AtuA family protein [Balneolales bacterium]|nr:acyclic terpene utilization AtuA family protein [Balneolales bacterium]